MAYHERANYYGLAPGKVNRSRSCRSGERIRPVLPSIPDAMLIVAQRNTLFDIYVILLLFFSFLIINNVPYSLTYVRNQLVLDEGTVEKFFLTY